MKLIKIKLLLALSGLILWGIPQVGMAQTAGDYFNRSARQYVNNDRAGAGQLLAEGLQKYPNDPKLNALLNKLQEEEDQEKQDQQQQDQDQQDQQQQDQDQQDQDSSESKDGEGEEQTQDDEASKSDEMEDKSGEQSQQDEQDPSGDLESDLSDREKAMEDLRQKLQEMNITPEQAKQILDAMDDAERRFIQQNQKKPTKRQERGLPDW